MANSPNFLVSNGSGVVVGAGYTPDGSYPANCYPCMPDQAKVWYLCTIVNGSVVQGAPPPLTLAQQASGLIASGIAITSTSASGLDGVYSTMPTAQASAASIAGYINSFGKFPGSAPSATMAYLDMSGKTHTFASTGQFLAFYQAAGDFVADCQMIILTGSGTLPAASVTIS